MFPKHKVLSHILCLHQWISNDQLTQYLKDPEQCIEAQHALEESQHADLDHEPLTQWCSAWLSKNGWKLLQDNVRQHHKQKKGAKYKRVMLEGSTVDDLYNYYAAKQGLSVNETVQALLQIANDVTK